MPKDKLNFTRTGLFRWFRCRYVSAANVIIFVGLAIWRGIPFRSWSKLWADFQAERVARDRKIVWQLIMAGKVRRDKEGHWAKEDKS
ncbi:hypothetical protein LCGC14_0928430 [marine sediment metagenome]|uniref:Uncharacterized protein n=1 Tax=marine sediment metagenome TaxID=412755 RepID=A0A0F9NNR4_9ZZZZ